MHIELILHFYCAAGEWYNGDVMENIEDALRTGGDPNKSDGYSINGLLGPSDACPDGKIIKQ
jgi:hypothetical protein